ncbi:hypothetical protein LSM04_004139 [Trypanosoma melophagium]|uniref:uncharacterized protein n=1 Tax=Trypanosoma melophagium TaxID=715481 RepID=UPI00351A4A3C|nr:hypothetical protein LSM04_004139 [Trypanosoma melophagium]
MNNYVLTAASESDFHGSFSDPTRRGRQWLSRQPISSEHPLCRGNSNDNGNRSTSSSSSRIVEALVTGSGVFAPAPIRPRMSMVGFSQLTSVSLNRRSVSTDAPDSPFTAAKGGMQEPHGVVKPVESQHSAETSRSTETLMPTSFSSFLPVNETPSNRNSSKKNGGGSSEHRSKSRHKNKDNVMTPWTGSITDGQTLLEFFSVSGSHSWVENATTDCGTHGMSSSSFSVDPVIDTDAAQTFQRDGARRARAAGPGFDKFPSPVCQF